MDGAPVATSNSDLASKSFESARNKSGLSRSFTPTTFRSQTDYHDVAIAIQTLGFARLLQCGASGGLSEYIKHLLSCPLKLWADSGEGG